MTLIKKVIWIITSSTLIIALLSCNKRNSENEPKYDIVKISGIYQSKVFYFTPENKIQFSFGFNEINNTNIQGGVRVIIIGAGIQPYRRVYKTKLTFVRWEESEGGRVSISAKGDFGDEEINDFREVKCTGTITNDSIFTFKIASYTFQYADTAILTGKYLSSIESGDVNYKGSYLVNYDESDSVFPSFCYPPNYCNSFENYLDVLNVSLDSIGGLNIDGNFIGYFPFGVNDTVQLMGDSDVFGGNYYIGIYGWDYSILGKGWLPNESGYGVYRIRFFDNCQKIREVKGSQIING